VAKWLEESTCHTWG